MFDSLLISAWGLAFVFLLLVAVSAAGMKNLLVDFFDLKAKDLNLEYFLLALGVLLSLCLLVGILPHGYTWYGQLAVLGPCLVLSWKSFQFKKPWKKLKFEKDQLWFLLPGLYFFVRFFSCGIPQQHSDAMYYHLAAPKLWAELGQIRLTAEHPSFAQTGFLEVIFGFPLLVFKTQGVFIKVATQIYAQWIHLFFGHVFSVFLGAKLIHTFLGSTQKKKQIFFMSWLAVSLPSLEWLSCLAKNDYVMTAFVLGAVLSVYQRNLFLAGLFAGFSYSTKTLGIMLIFTLPLFCVLTRQHKPKDLAKAVFAGFLGLAPFLLRNLIWTQNPMFPYYDNTLGPGWISDFWYGHLNASGGRIGFNSEMFYWLKDQLFLKILPKIILALGALTLIVQTFKTKNIWHGKFLIFLVALMTFALILLKPHADGRYAIYVAILCTLFTSAAFLKFLHSLKLKKKYSDGISVGLFALGFLINIPLDVLVKIPRDYLFEVNTKYLEQFHWTYDSKKWLNENTNPSATILFTADKMNYYMDRPYETMHEMKRWEEEFKTIHNAKDFFKRVKSLGYRYVHLNIESPYPSWLRPYWDEIMALKGSAVFSSSSSLIFDVY